MPVHSKPTQEPTPPFPATPTPLRTTILIGLLLVCVTLAVYQPAFAGAFLFDDDIHVFDNPVLKPGGLLQTWIPGSYLSYWPLTFTVYGLEYMLWGFNCLGLHGVNMLLHTANVLLVWRLLTMLRVPGALWGAAIFALHPVNVESVAWISQLKGILALLLAVLSMIYYVHNQERGRRWDYVLSVTLFLLAALAKGAALTLPAVMLMLAWWRRGRIIRLDWWRVVPYVLIGTVMACVEVRMQQGSPTPALHAPPATPYHFFDRAAAAGCAVWFYLGKLIWPTNLSAIYPRWSVDAGHAFTWVPGALLLLIVVLAWRQRRRWGRPVFMLLICYAAMLLPVLGFADIGFLAYSRVADHYQYLALVIPAAVLSGGATKLLAPWLGPRVPPGSSPAPRNPRPPTSVPPRGIERRRNGVVGVAACVVVCLATLSFRQARTYAGPETFWPSVLTKNPACYLAHFNFAAWLYVNHELGPAIDHYHEALHLDEEYLDARYNLAIALNAAGRYPEAITEYEEMLRRTGLTVPVCNNLGVALANAGQFDQAIELYEQALKINPQFVDARYNICDALHRAERTRQAIDRCVAELKLVPNEERIEYLLVWLLAANDPGDGGDPSRAMALAQRLYARAQAARDIALAARDLDVWAIACASAGDFPQAIDRAQHALQLARSIEQTSRAQAITARLDLYRAHRPFRDSKTSTTRPRF